MTEKELTRAEWEMMADSSDKIADGLEEDAYKKIKTAREFRLIADNQRRKALGYEARPISILE